MTDRKYGQRGYRESDKEGGGNTQKPSAPPTGGMLGSRTAFRCVDCGALLPSLTELPTQCPTCRSELHSCQQCAHFSPGRRFECTQAIAERVPDKRARNECTFFSMRATVERETSSGSKHPEDARRTFHDLFKK